MTRRTDADPRSRRARLERLKEGEGDSRSVSVEYEFKSVSAGATRRDSVRARDGKGRTRRCRLQMSETFQPKSDAYAHGNRAHRCACSRFFRAQSSHIQLEHQSLALNERSTLTGRHARCNPFYTSRLRTARPASMFGPPIHRQGTPGAKDIKRGRAQRRLARGDPPRAGKVSYNSFRRRKAANRREVLGEQNAAQSQLVSARCGVCATCRHRVVLI